MRRLLLCHGLFNMSRSFISAVLVVYLLDSGVGLDTISLAKAVQLIVTLVLNVPAGWLADRRGNKACVMAACFCAMAYLLLLLRPGTMTVIVGEAFNGLALVFYKGAYEAWIFGYRNRRENSFSLVFRSNEIMYAAMMTAGVAGAALAAYSIHASLVVMAVAALLFFGVAECPPGPQPDAGSSGGPLGALAQAGGATLLLYVALAGSARLLYQYWPVYLRQAPAMPLDQMEIGMTFGVCMLAQALAASVTRRHPQGRGSSWRFYAAAALVLGAAVAVIAPAYALDKTAVAAIYIFLATAVGLNVGLLFSRVCDSIVGSGHEGSLISAMDAAARLCGAVMLLVIWLRDINDISLIWAPLLACSVLLFGHALFGRMRQQRAGG